MGGPPVTQDSDSNPLQNKFYSHMSEPQLIRRRIDSMSKSYMFNSAHHFTCKTFTVSVQSWHNVECFIPSRLTICQGTQVPRRSLVLACDTLQNPGSLNQCSDSEVLTIFGVARAFVLGSLATQQMRAQGEPGDNSYLQAIGHCNFQGAPMQKRICFTHSGSQWSKRNEFRLKASDTTLLLLEVFHQRCGGQMRAWQTSDGLIQQSLLLTTQW